jgi:hypothetical protein
MNGLKNSAGEPGRLSPSPMEPGPTDVASPQVSAPSSAETLKPLVRADGRCAQCLKPRKMPRAHHKSIDPAVYELDPFCSSSCCRIWHGLEPAKPREFAARNKTCSGCGVAMDERTVDCRQCNHRFRNRDRATAARAA